MHFLNNIPYVPLLKGMQERSLYWLSGYYGEKIERVLRVIAPSRPVLLRPSCSDGVAADAPELITRVSCGTLVPFAFVRNRLWRLRDMLLTAEIYFIMMSVGNEIVL